MASYHDLLDAIARIGVATGNPDAWKDGLTGADVAVACTPMSPPGAVTAVLAKLAAAHPAVFAPTTAQDPLLPTAAEGATADAIRGAESVLARQRSDAAHLDLQVLTAIADAHTTAAEGQALLAGLQREIETAVASRTDLDTPAGARELQRFLIGKMRDIRNVVEHAGLDSGSKASLAEALVALYASSTPEVPDRAPISGSEKSTPATPVGRDPVTTSPFAGDAGPPPSTVLDDSGAALPDYLPTDFPMADSSPLPSPAAAMTTAAAPTMPVMPPFGGALPAAAPFAGATPFGGPFGSGPSAAPFGAPPSLGGSPWSDLSPAELPTADLLGNDGRGVDEPSPAGGPPHTSEEPVPDASVEESAESSSPEAPTEPTPVFLPDGQTVIAPSPELASVITAAVAGAPIPDAFAWQGITIPAPGSPVVAPVDPARVVPGDIAVLADRHALALGNGKALLDKQIQPVGNVTGSGFVGWQHPPAPVPSNTPTVLPAPDRSAATAPS